jgi:hypothetical protein
MQGLLHCHTVLAAGTCIDCGSRPALSLPGWSAGELSSTLSPKRPSGAGSSFGISTARSSESRELAPGIDLRRLFVASILEWMDDGWTVGEFSSASAAFFCARSTERRKVAIERLNPRGVASSGASHLMGSTKAGR